MSSKFRTQRCDGGDLWGVSIWEKGFELHEATGVSDWKAMERGDGDWDVVIHCS